MEVGFLLEKGVRGRVAGGGGGCTGGGGGFLNIWEGGEGGCLILPACSGSEADAAPSRDLGPVSWGSEYRA